MQSRPGLGPLTVLQAKETFTRTNISVLSLLSFALSKWSKLNHDRLKKYSSVFDGAILDMFFESTSQKKLYLMNYIQARR